MCHVTNHIIHRRWNGGYTFVSKSVLRGALVCSVTFERGFPWFGRVLYTLKLLHTADALGLRSKLMYRIGTPTTHA